MQEIEQLKKQLSSQGGGGYVMSEEGTSVDSEELKKAHENAEKKEK